MLDYLNLNHPLQKLNIFKKFLKKDYLIFLKNIILKNKEVIRCQENPKFTS